MSIELPKFKYFSDPVKTRIIVAGSTECPVCNKIRDYIYEGPFFSREEVEGICPWCIADGSAAQKFHGAFIDLASCESVDNEEFIDILIHKTPSYIGWQQEKWLSHCEDFCEFIDYAGWDDIKDIQNELKDDIETIKKELRIDQNLLEKRLLKRGSLSGYLFNCLHCGKPRLTYDLD